MYNLTHEPISKLGFCYSDDVVIHELVHAWGFHHEQARADRDDYVTILENNIVPNMIHNFEKEPESNSYGVPYDGVSLMHYGRNFFSKNGFNTIESKVNMISILLSLPLTSFPIIGSWFQV